MSAHWSWSAVGPPAAVRPHPAIAADVPPAYKPESAGSDANGIAGEEDDFAVLAVLCAPMGQPATVNLMAPIVVNSETRKGAQVILEGSRFSTREVFVTPQPTRVAATESSEPMAVQAAG